MSYCPAYPQDAKVPKCPASICDCFIDQFPDDPDQAGAPHPEFFVVLNQKESTDE